MEQTLSRQSYHGHSQPPNILVEPMMQQAAVRVPADDWTGITSTAERRRLQNRLNSRLYRKRKSLKKTTISHENHMELERRDSAEAEGSDRAGAGLSCMDIVPTHNSLEGLCIGKLASTFSKLSLSETQRVIIQALVTNTSALGFTTAWMDAEAESPFNTPNPGYDINLSCPVHLRPTALQRAIEHHPWIDLFPIPELRDNILRLGDSYDDTPLCIQMLEFCDIPHEKTGLIAWGDPWDPSGWEISEEFLRKWPWVLNGCHELFRSTNLWREKRGENKLFVGY